MIYIRGGSWYHNVSNVRPENRNGIATARRNNRLGFRVVRSYE